MPISTELMTALLSMDGYNRGYGEGISGLGGIGSQIGNATFANQSSTLAGSTEVNAGFYASSYTWNGKTIISYRGTNSDSMSALGIDAFNGWITGTGAPFTQSTLASIFYQNVTGQSINGGAAANTILTGHSLGGGLAG